jgi:hypothetical protein
MKKETKQFERQFIRVRDGLERKAIRIIRAAIAEQYKSVLSKFPQTDFRQWPNLADSISERPIEIALEKVYTSVAPLATMNYKRMLGKKADEEEQLMTAVFQRQMKEVVRGEMIRRKISTITHTSTERIRKVIVDIIDIGETEGYGIPEITKNIYRAVGESLRGNGYARSKAIAQTEIISASNQASERAANATGYDYVKFWSTSGLPGIRISHIEAEQYSDDKGGLKPDEPFQNGLMYPGDPSGEAAEVINCRCTILHEII